MALVLTSSLASGWLWINQVRVGGPLLRQWNHFCQTLQRPSHSHWRYPPHLPQAQESGHWKPKKVQKKVVLRIANQVAPRYVRRDPRLTETLARIRRNGRKTFLLTNSDWWFVSECAQTRIFQAFKRLCYGADFWGWEKRRKNLVLLQFGTLSFYS